MSTYLKKFNLICEEKQLELIFEDNGEKKDKKSFLSSLSSYFQKRWSLEDEFKTMLEFMVNKVKLAFTSLYEQGKPGELVINGTPEEIIPIEEGTQTPGFKAIYNINEDYAKNSLIPCLMNTARFKKLNERFTFDVSGDSIDAKLIIKVNASSEKSDLSKPNIKIPKFSIQNWDGNVYLNLKCEKVNREKSNINIGKITTKVEVKEYRSLLPRISDFLWSIDITAAQRKGIHKTLGESLCELFGKQKNDGWDKIKSKSLIGNIGRTPGATIKCIVTLDRNLKKDETLEKEYEDYLTQNRYNRANKLVKKQTESGIEYRQCFMDANAIEEQMSLDDFYKNLVQEGDNIATPSNQIISNNTYDEYDYSIWTTADRREDQFISNNKSVTEKYINSASEGNNEYICLNMRSFLHNSNKKFNKIYQFFFNIVTYKENGEKNGNYNGKDLLIRKFDAPMCKILITNDADEHLFIRYYDFFQFEKVESNTFKKVKNTVENIKYTEENK